MAVLPVRKWQPGYLSSPVAFPSPSLDEFGVVNTYLEEFGLDFRLVIANNVPYVNQKSRRKGLIIKSDNII